MNIKTNKGITFIEIITVVAIISVISVVAIINLSAFKNQQVLKNTTVEIVSVLNKARQNTLSSLNSINYGVHFETGTVTLFTGSTYVNGASTNEIMNLSSSVVIPSSGGITISGGGSDIIFERLTGNTTVGTTGIVGTIVIRLVSDTTKEKTITISKTGIISTN